MIIIPFGYSCTPADALKFGGLREFSLPFDYLFAYADNIKRTLDTDFQEWFETDKMQVFSNDPNDIGRVWTKHSKYREYENDTVAGFFNHFDMTDISVQEAFKRRIKRYKDIIDSDEDIIFLTTSTPEEIMQNGLLDYYKRNAKTIFVYMELTGSDSNYANYIIKNGRHTIEYKSTDRINSESGSLICEQLRLFINIDK